MFRVRLGILPGVLALSILTLASFDDMCQAAKIILEKKDSGKTVEAHVGDIVEIHLSGTPTTGFWWHFEPVDPQYLEFIGQQKVEHQEHMREGAPISGIWQYLAKKDGTAHIRAHYYRSWEQPGRPQEEFSVLIRMLPASDTGSKSK